VIGLSVACFFQWRHSAGLQARVNALQAKLDKGRQMQATPSATPTVQQLHLAVYKGDLTRIRSLLDAHPEWLNANTENKFKNTALHFAAYYGQEEVVAELIKRGAAVNAQNRNGNTPFHDAITSESSSHQAPAQKWRGCERAQFSRRGSSATGGHGQPRDCRDHSTV
jgi:hypothetical protein